MFPFAFHPALPAQHYPARLQVIYPQARFCATTEIPYIFKAKDLEGRVKEAVEQGRQKYDGPIHQVIEQYGNHLDKVFAVLKTYVDDPDSSVQFALIEAASLAPQRPEAMAILIRLMPDEDIGWSAVQVIYERYSQDQIIKRGGLPLKNALFRNAMNSRWATQTYLLMSLYDYGPSVTRFLRTRRATFARDALKSRKPNEERIDRTRESVALDLGLIEMQDAEALQRVKLLLQHNKTEEVTALLQFLKFVRNKTVLMGAVELLHNKNIAQQSFSANDNSVVSSVRVCDKALLELRSRFDGTPRPFSFELPNFSDAKLEAAYQKYKAQVAKLPG